MNPIEISKFLTFEYILVSPEGRYYTGKNLNKGHLSANVQDALTYTHEGAKQKLKYSAFERYTIQQKRDL